MWKWLWARGAILALIWRMPWWRLARFLGRLSNIPPLEDDLRLRRWCERQWYDLDRMAAATGTEIDDLLLDVVEHNLKDPVAWERLVQAIRAVGET